VCRAFTSSVISSGVVSPCVTHARMISRSSNVAAATQTQPEERIFPTIDRASLNWGGGWIHNTATGDSLRIVHSRTRSYCLSSSVSGARQGNPNPRYYSLARGEYGSTGNASYAATTPQAHGAAAFARRAKQPVRWSLSLTAWSCNKMAFNCPSSCQLNLLRTWLVAGRRASNSPG
jgi:hypothetical protein